jgi:hypothetical protein
MTRQLYEQAVTIASEELRLAEGYEPRALEVFVPESLYRAASACGAFIRSACQEIPEATSEDPFWPYLQSTGSTPIHSPRMDALPAYSGRNSNGYHSDRLLIAADDDVLKIQSMATETALAGSKSLTITRYRLAEGQDLSGYVNLRMTKFNDFSVLASRVLLDRSTVEFKRSHGVIGASVELFHGFKDNSSVRTKMATYGDEGHSATIHTTFLNEALATVNSINNLISK